MASKSNTTDVSRLFAELSMNIENKLSYDDTTLLLKDYVLKNDVHYLLSNKVSLDEVKSLMENKASSGELKSEMNLFNSKLDEF